MADVTARCEHEAELTRRDRGFSLLEVLVTIALTAVVIVPILGAVVTSITSSSPDGGAAQVETALVNAADRVNRADNQCDYTIYAQAAVQSQGWAPDRVSVQHAYYQPGPTPADPGTWIDGRACALATATGDVVQRVVISVTSPDGHISREIQVVKRDV